jgi:hypothetical protein
MAVHTLRDLLTMTGMMLFSLLKLSCFYSQVFSATHGVDALTSEKETRHVKSTQAHRVPCPDVEHVCTSLLKMDGVLSTEQGSYCACKGCEDPPWNEDDKKSLTWYHFERNDWMVQYRFCEPLMPKHECHDPEEVAAVIRTDAKGWNPRIKKLYCSCPKNRYFLQGWTLVHGTAWDYHYTCDRPSCDDNPCMKHYLTSEEDAEKTTGYKFLCSCADGYKCPTSQKHAADRKREKRDAPTKNTDNSGDFVYGYCERHTNTPKGSSNLNL